MSYEGRVIYLCDCGHLTTMDCYNDFPDYETDPSTGFIFRKNKDNKIFEKEFFRCRFCGACLRRIGGVDDTNDVSVANFYLKTIRPEATIRYSLGSRADVVEVTHRQPAIYSVVRGKSEEFFDFNSGKKLKNH